MSQATATPTMDGFEWTERPEPLTPDDGNDGYCLRDAVCQLYGWGPGSADREAFIREPAGGDSARFFEHLGLSFFDFADWEQWKQLHQRLDHPGIALFGFPSVKLSHVVFVSWVEMVLHHWQRDGQPITVDRPVFGWPLGIEHLEHDPQLWGIVVHESRPGSNFAIPNLPPLAVPARYLSGDSAA